jgi:hypothetical protein
MWCNAFFQIPSVLCKVLDALLVSSLPLIRLPHGGFVATVASKLPNCTFNVFVLLLSCRLLKIANDRMHSTARRCGYSSDSTRAVRVLAIGAGSEQPLEGSIFRRSRPTNSPLSPPPAASAAGPGATRPGLCARSGSETASVTALGLRHRPWTSPSRVAGWVLTADRYRSVGPAGRSPQALILGVSWAARWCGGSPERTATVESASWLGSRSRSELPGHRYREWSRLGRSGQPRFCSSGRHPGLRHRDG